MVVRLRSFFFVHVQYVPVLAPFLLRVPKETHAFPLFFWSSYQQASSSNGNTVIDLTPREVAEGVKHPPVNVYGCLRSNPRPGTYTLAILSYPWRIESL